MRYRAKMKKEQFEKLKANLLERGYRIYNQNWHREDYVIGKSFHKYDNPWEENRAAIQIIISVYDYSDKPEYWDRIPQSLRDRVGLDVWVCMSRTIDERLDLSFAWHDDETIEQIEDVAEQFYVAMCNIFKKPREEQITV